jgi:hypothetical protein
MKKLKQYYPVNNQEDEDSSSYPLYPDAEYVYNKAKNKNEASGEIKIGEPASELQNQQDKKSHFDSMKSNR